MRRGSMTEEAKFDNLKELRDSYINKYDLLDGDEKELLYTNL